MTVLVAFSAHIHDWRALRNLHSETLLRQARELGAVHYRVFRNARNAAEVLIIVELSAYEDAQEMALVLGVQLLSILADAPRVAGFWEDMEWEAIGP